MGRQTHCAENPCHTGPHAPASTTDGEDATHKVHWLCGDGERPPAQLVGCDDPLAELGCQRLSREVEWVEGLMGH